MLDQESIRLLGLILRMDSTSGPESLPFPSLFSLQHPSRNNSFERKGKLLREGLGKERISL